MQHEMEGISLHLMLLLGLWCLSFSFWQSNIYSRWGSSQASLPASTSSIVVMEPAFGTFGSMDKF